MGFQKSAVLRTEGRSARVSGGAAPGGDVGSLGDAWQLIGDAIAGAHCTWYRSKLKSQFLCS